MVVYVRIRKIIFVLILLLININVIKAANLTIMPIDTNEWGDSTLLESAGEYLLMDVSYANNTSVLDFLIRKNVKKFSIYLSHYHEDHYGSHNKLTIDGKKMDLMEYLIRNQNKGKYKNYLYTIDILYLPNPKVCEVSGATSCMKEYNRLKSAAQEMGIKVVLLDTGSSFKLGNTNAKVLYMNTDTSDYVNPIGSVANNCSLVTKFTNGSVKFLTAGDIEKITEEKLLKLKIDLSADIFKLNHHGLQYKNELSNNLKFIEKVNPKYAYVQFNETNKWGYKYRAIKTSVDNLNLIKSANIYNTNINGNVKYVIKNNEITPVAEKGVYQVTINYIDQDTNQILSTKEYDFSYSFYGNEIKYHLYDYQKSFSGYSLVTDMNSIEKTGVLKGNKKYNIYYTKVKPNKITLSTNQLELKVGESKTVTITNVEPSGTKCKTVVWNSDNKNIVTVSSGKINALSAGSAKVTVNCDGIVAPINVVVKGVTITNKITIMENEIKQLVGSSAVKEWSTSNKSLATITGQGELTAKAVGTVTITADLVNGNTERWIITIVKSKDEVQSGENPTTSQPEQPSEENIPNNQEEVSTFIRDYLWIFLIIGVIVVNSLFIPKRK